ncbi:hypothetical protein Tco_0204656 [Tanacetum coccineum]
MGILYKSMDVQNKLGLNNLVLVLKQESMEYMMKNVFGLRWNCKELKGIVKLRFSAFRNGILQWLKDDWWERQPEEKDNTGTCLVKEQEKEHQTGWKIKMGNVLDSCNQGLHNNSGLSKIFWAEDTTKSTYLVNKSPSSAIGFKMPIDMLGFFGWLASIKQGMLEPVKVKCIFLGYHRSIVGNKLWRLDGVTSKVVLYRNMGFNESGEYKKTFIGSGVCMGSVQVLHGFEFEMCMYSSTVVGNAVTTTMAIIGSIHQAEIWATKDLLDKAKGNILGMEIIRDQSGYGLMILGCARSLKANLNYMEALSTTEARYVTFTKAWKKEIWLKGLLTEFKDYELRVSRGIATGCLVTAVPYFGGSMHKSRLLRIGID